MSKPRRVTDLTDTEIDKGILRALQELHACEQRRRAITAWLEAAYVEIDVRKRVRRNP